MQAQLHEHTTTDSYDLFRRAIVERDQDAWAETAARYRPLLAAWASRCSASATLSEQYGDLADQAFARAWQALSPARFAAFPNVAALMGYLRACVTSTVIDCARSELSHQRIEQQLDCVESDFVTPERVVLHAFNRQEVWRIAAQVIASEQERVVLHESFVYDMKPRDIFERHRELFGDMMEIYSAKRNVLDRLKRSTELRQLYQDWSRD